MSRASAWIGYRRMREGWMGDQVFKAGVRRCVACCCVSEDAKGKVGYKAKEAK